MRFQYRRLFLFPVKTERENSELATSHMYRRSVDRVQARPHETTRLPLDIFAGNLISEYSSKTRPENTTFIEIRQE